MLKHTKQFLMLFLIGLQLFAPFIHAHAFEHHGFKEHAFHLHADETAGQESSKKSAVFTDLSVNITQQKMACAITMVANGIRQACDEDVADNIAFIAILFTLTLLFFNVPRKLFSKHYQAIPYQRIAYSLQNSRAPPR